MRADILGPQTRSVMDWTIIAMEQLDEGIANSTAIVCYEGPEGTMAVGECRAGVRYCTDGGFDGPCDGQRLPGHRAYVITWTTIVMEK